MPRARGRRGKGKGGGAFLFAGLDGTRTLHLECKTSAPQRELTEMIRTAQNWSDGHRSPTPALPGGANASRVYQFVQSAAASLAAELPVTALASSVPHPHSELLRTLNKEEKDCFAASTPEKQAEYAQGFAAVSAHRPEAPLRLRVLSSALPVEVRHRILAKLDKMSESLTTGDSVKFTTWVECQLSIPLGRFTMALMGAGTAERMANARAHLNRTTFGQEAAKQALLERYYCWLTAPHVSQRPIALVGVPGNGKTTLIREGFAALSDRPFHFVSLGGSSDASTLIGHGYTYEGSTMGRLAEGLALSRCMNPVFYFDEVDKCSTTPRGEEITNCLVHLTDPAQNMCFRDRYLHGVDLNVSGCLFVFALNDINLVSPVLRDRMDIIETESFSAAHLAIITNDYLIPRTLKERGLSESFMRVDQKALDRLTSTCMANEGARRVKNVIECAITKLVIYDQLQDFSLCWPFTPEAFTVDKSGHGKTYILRSSGVEGILKGRARRCNGVPAGMYA